MITHFERLDDGRYNIVLRGVDRFRVIEEDHEASYRRAMIEVRDRGPLVGERSGPSPRCTARKLDALLAPAVERGRDRRSRWHRITSLRAAASGMTDTDLVNALAQYLDLEPLEKLALLEHDASPRARPIARRAARDEDHDRAHAERVERLSLRAQPVGLKLATLRDGGDDLDDLLAVEPAVLDEDVAGVHAGHRAAGDEEAGTFVSKVSRIEYRRLRSLSCDPGRRHQIPIRVIAGEQEHGVRRNFLDAVTCSVRPCPDDDGRGTDFPDAGVEPRRDRPFLDAVLDIGTHPVLDRRLQLRRAVHERHVRAGAKHLERRFGGGIAAADNDHALR